MKTLCSSKCCRGEAGQRTRELLVMVDLWFLRLMASSEYPKPLENLRKWNAEEVAHPLREPAKNKRQVLYTWCVDTVRRRSFCWVLALCLVLLARKAAWEQEFGDFLQMAVLEKCWNVEISHKMRVLNLVSVRNHQTVSFCFFWNNIHVQYKCMSLILPVFKRQHENWKLSLFCT